MICPACQHSNPDGTPSCTQCGAALAPPAASASAPTQAGRNRTGLVVAGVLLGVLLLFAAGAYMVFHAVARKVHALAGGDAQDTAQLQDAGTPDEPGKRSAREAGNAIGAVLGTDAKGKSDIANAIGGVLDAGDNIQRHDAATGNADGTPDAADTQQAMGAVGGLLGALGGALGGATRHDPVDFHVLETLLPAALPGMQRATPQGSTDQAIGIATTAAGVDFNSAGGARVNVSIKDATAMSALAGIADMANSQQTEQGDSYQRNETIDGRRVHAAWDAGTRHGSLSLIVARRFGVDVTGDNVDMDTLHDALAQVDLRKLESMRDANAKAR